ncbi:MAG: MFS transporter [Thermoleophilaceae bacterium]|nr:MFS transporter [Thermoleophilaceae bacterium]
MRHWRVLMIMCAAQFIMVLDTTVMNVSVSAVVEDLDTSISMVQLAITLYTLVMGSFMLLGGKLGDIFGRRKIFGIGLITYGLGSLITALSPNVGWLLFGWSGIEGIGAVLVMPAIISLTASNYTGRDRATAYGALGGIAAAGAAAGPLIGGFVTEEWTWRVVFASETLVCVVIVMFMKTIADTEKPIKSKIDLVGVTLSSLGFGLIVLAALKSAEWGLIQPTGALTINGREITPFGLSVVPFMVAAGGFLLRGFFGWERRLIARDGSPLVHPDLLHKLQLRNGLAMLTAQQMVIGGVFFIIPIYLQYVLLKNAFETGVKLAPMSVAMLVAAFSGPKLAVKFSPRKIVSVGLVLVILGSLVLVTTIDPELNDLLFAIGMAIFGAGFGLVASQLGNVIMSSVGDKARGEAGGLQGTAQNIGSSLGVALIGAIMISSLSSGFNSAAQADQSLSAQSQAAVAKASAGGIDIVTKDQLNQAAADSGLPKSDTDKLIAYYEDAQIQAIKESILLAALLAAIGLIIAQRLPKIPGVELGAPEESDAPLSAST